MTDKSQTVKDVINDYRNRLEDLIVDKPLRNARDLFEKATTPLNPQIYKGDFKSYRSHNTNYESANETLDRMSKESDTVKDWISNERYEAEKRLPPNQRGYNFGRDTASDKPASFEDTAKQYLMSEGKELYAHLRKQGRDFYDITRIGTANLENAVAALAIKGTEAALLGSTDFDKKIIQLATQYGVSKDRATKYVMAHEFVHASQKGKYFDDHILAELDVEHTLKEYFTAKGDKDLAAIASDRASNVTRNYGGAGSYKMPKIERSESYSGIGSSGKSAYNGVTAGKASYSAASAN